MGTVVIVNKDQMGSGDTELGRKLLGSCLRQLVYAKDLDAIAFYNGGVLMVKKDSPVSGELGLLQEKGIDLLVCQTCVNHFDLTGKLLVDRLSNMGEIVAAMESADKVITL